MAEVILMPRLSDTMTEGVIAAWHKKVGEKVKKGDVLADIETDKATMELESYQDGFLLHIGTENGGKLQVNDLMAIIGKEGEDIKELVTKATNGSPKELEPEQPKNEETAAGEKEEAPTPKREAAAPASQPAPAAALDLKTISEVVLMPRLSDTMTEGVIANWLKNVGDAVKKGEVLAEIETDKATMELESYKDGKLLYQGAKAGEKIQVNDLLCIIANDGFDIAPIVQAAKGNAAPQAATAPAVENATITAAPENETEKQAEPTPQIVNEGRIIASPLAKKLAEEKAIDLRLVKGSGDGGRIVKTDVDAYVPATKILDAPPKTATTAAPKQSTESGAADFEEVAVSQMRKTIARRLSESMYTAPHFYLTVTVDMDACVAARTKINETAKAKISFNDMVLKAAAVALKQHPKVNSSWQGEKIRINHHVNIGVAVAVDEGLLVPVIRFADTKTLSQIGAEVKDFAQKAKDKKLQPADWEGSTFTISNLGMFGIDQFTAIINTPDACILAVGGIALVPVVKNGQIVPGNVMKLTLSCDHRVVDGATGAAFMQTLKALLEEPLRMLL